MAAKKKTSKKTKTKNSTNERSIFTNLIRWAWILTILGLVCAVAIFLVVSISKLPNTEELENPKYDIASLVYSSDGEQLGRYFVQNRSWTTFEELNPYLVDALVATEDERFFKHSGVDVKGTLRAVAFMGSKGGASTITQQLAKLFFTNKSRSFPKRVWQKLKEWVIAFKFEKRYTKKEIMAMYLNKVDFLYNSHGVNAAAETYFGKTQDMLTMDEAAMIVGMLKNPSYFSPKKYPERAQRRRNVVLGQMLRNKFITKEKFDELKVLELDGSKFSRRNNYSGIAPYFRAELTKWLNDLLKDDKYTKEDGSKYSIYRDGLKIYTSIDSRMQKHAESAMVTHMSKLQDRFFNRWEGKDPWTYDADDRQIKLRRSSLNAHITNSDRYKLLRKKYLTKVSQEISREIENVKLRDTDIRRMLKATKTKGHLAALVKNKTISKNMSKTYTQIVRSPHWKTLKKRWALFQSVVKRDFNKKAKMKVFAYNDNGYVIKTMTPIDSIKYHRMHMQIGSLSIEPQTGYVKAWVGGVNHDYFKFDHIQNDRQVGSTFKPFLYATAISHLAMSPCQKVRDQRYTIPARDSDFGLMKAWSPENWDEKYSNTEITLKEALQKSKNTISAWLIKEIKNPRLVGDLAENMGVSKAKIPNVPSIALGAADLSVMDMTGAYSTFANNGVFVKPTFVTRIEDKNGKEIYRAVPDGHRALSPDYNYVMVDMLQNAVASKQAELEVKFGGKTGTTNNHVDGWFMGITPDLVVGTWVGGEDPWIKFNTIGDGSGAAMARPFYLEYMKKIEADNSIGYNSEAVFKVPENLSVTIDCEVYDAFIKENTAKRTTLEDALEDEFDESELEEELEEELDEFEG